MSAQMIQPNEALKALLEGNDKVLALWSQADGEIRELINLWASMDGSSREAAALDIKRKAEDTP